MFARRRHRGVVLILVLLLLTLLVVVVGQLTYTTSVDRLLAANQSEDQQVELALASGIEYARALLAADAGGEARHDAPGEPWSRRWTRRVGDVEVRAADAAALDAQHQLVGPGLRVRHLLDRQGLTQLAKDRGTHGSSPPPPASRV